MTKISVKQAAQSAADGAGASFVASLPQPVVSCPSQTQERVQGSLTRREFCKECKDCREVRKDSIAWAKKMQAEFRKAGRDRNNRTLEDVNKAVEKSLADQGITTEVVGTTDSSGTITVQRRQGPCARLEEKSTERHEKVHAQHTRDLQARYGVGTPEFDRHFNDAADAVHDEVNAYQADVNFWNQFKRECRQQRCR